jgi:hypothetical protein
VHARRGANEVDGHLVHGCTLCRSRGRYFFVERKRDGDALMGDTDESPGPASWTDVECYLARDEVGKVVVECHLQQRAVVGLTLIVMPEGQYMSRGMSVEGFYGIAGRGELRAVETQGHLYEVDPMNARMRDVKLVFCEP